MLLSCGILSELKMPGELLEEKAATNQSAVREQSVVAVACCEPTRSTATTTTTTTTKQLTRNKGSGRSESKQWLCSSSSNSSSGSSSGSSCSSKGLLSSSASGGSCEAAGSCWLVSSNAQDDSQDTSCEKLAKKKQQQQQQQQNRGNNSNYKSNKSKYHYTKIFRQYLPTSCSLNLSYALTLTTKPTNIEEEEAVVVVAKEEGSCINKTTTTTSNRSSSSASFEQQQQHHYHLNKTSANQPTIFSKSIVNALNKLRVSSGSTSQSSASYSSSSSSFERHSFHEQSYDINKLNSNDSKKFQHHQQVSKRIRKSFLYLKVNGQPSSEFGNHCYSHKSSDKHDLLMDEHVQAQLSAEEKRSITSSSSITRRCRDLNNNSISSLLSSSTRHNDEHKTNLIKTTSEEEEDQQQKLNKIGKPVKSSSSQQVGRKMSHTQSRVVSAISITCITALFAALAITVVLSQQQQPSVSQVNQQQQPFSRSQQPISGVSSSAANQRPTPQPAAGSLVANINCNKIRGHVTLTPNLRGGTTVSTQILAGPPGEVYQWSVHQFPVKPGAAMCSCSPLILGTKLLDLSDMHGNLPSDQEFSVQSSLNLFGAESPVGHSLMLRGLKTGMVACATFLPTSRKSNYRAKFHTPLSGSVTIFQTAFGTSFISHLMYSNGSRRHSMHRFDLMKSDDDFVATTLLSGAPGGQSAAAGSQQQTRLAENELREHEHELSQCRRFNTGEALLKNISYQLAVSTENFGMRGRTALVLPQIPFETFSAVYLVVYSEYDPLEPIACAPLKFVKPKTAAAKFQSVSVQGSVLFSQDSPYDVTVARINLNLPNSDGHSYGIDELPMIIRRKSDTRVCPNIREIIYNPHHVEPSSVPLEGEATSDQYAVGDLSGKYGSLTGKAVEKLQVNDYNLPLFGPISIVGRAMTVYSAEGVAIACSNVELTTPMTTAFATFDYGIQGQFIFRQPLNDCNGDTYVYIEVSKPVTAGSSSSQNSANGVASQDNFRSLDHNWHIHVNPVDSGLDHLSTTECAAAGPHYNPYNTSTTSIYSRDCTPFNVLRCELGDLSAKMFTIDIPPYRVKGGQEPDIGKFFGTDIDLPLCGPVSVVNRSVVVHVQDFGSQRLACSTVIEFKPRSS